MKKIKLVIFYLSLVAYIRAQAPQRFYTTFGGEGEDVGYSGKQLLDGQYIVAGSTSSFGNGGADVYLLKVDSMGFAIWQRAIGGMGNDVGKSVIQLPDSGFVIAGFTNSFGSGGYDAYIVRTDKNGVVIWEKTYGGKDWDFANDLVAGSDGNIYVAGYTSSFGSGKKDGFILKYDLLGNLIWNKLIGGVENEELRSIIKTNDNMIATVGFTESKKDKVGDGYFLKLNLNGDTLFTRTFGGGGAKDFANDLVQKATGDYVLCGAKTYSVNGFTESLMYSISTVGDSLWERRLLKSQENESFMSAANSLGTPSITAFIRTINFSVTKKQIELFAAIYGGGEQIINASGDFGDEIGYSVEGTRDGGYLVVGSTNSYDANDLDVYFVKRDAAGLNYPSIVDVTKVTSKLPYSFKRIDKHLVLSVTHQTIKKLEITNLNGQLISTYTPMQNEVYINIEELTPSIYFINAKLNDGETLHYKFIK